MSPIAPLKDVALPFGIVAGAIVIVAAATVGVLSAFAPEKASVNGVSPKVGRFTLAPAVEPGTLWILDTATGQVRGCGTDDTTLSPTCDVWSET